MDQLYVTADPAERAAILSQLLERIEIEIAGAWVAGDPDRARALEGQCEVFAVWREAELAALAPEIRTTAQVSG